MDSTRNETGDNKTANLELPLIVAYHASARAELISRLERRDSALFLYLAAVATVFSVVAADWKQRVPVLLVIPLLGLGASFVYSQHNTVVGALGLYIGKELHEASAAIVGTDGVVRSWDASNTLKNTTRPLKARLASGLIILVGPSLAACTLAPFTRPSAAVIGAALGGATVSAWMAGTLLVSHRERARLRAAIL